MQMNVDTSREAVEFAASSWETIGYDQPAALLRALLAERDALRAEAYFFVREINAVRETAAEAYRRGQEDMRERAAELTENKGPYHKTRELSTRALLLRYKAAAIRALPVNNPE